MGERNIVRAFREPDSGRFNRAVEATLEKIGGAIQWDKWPANGRDASELYCAIGHRPEVQTIEIPYVRDALDFLFIRQVGSLLDVPWMEIRVQEGSHWDCTLYRGWDTLDNFSTLPQYWDPEDEELLEMKRGNPNTVATVWGIPAERIQRYMVNWGYEEDDDEGCYRTLLQGKAYEIDRHSYGDIWQMQDFIHALGGCYPGSVPNDPYYGGSVHTISLPTTKEVREQLSKPPQ